ncbi:fumarylacetoacetate hydrolase family protein [Gracilibacillus caseinilyticus]|uniref:Fumarylacetoacetate hydrolase family protein n=1 Tax=Gracilibacillus caseinilyticus TaxID=2932256 RepID=A0ABY4F1B6_9BACI|nr:fumarylacetoacetate hydrolase family protein [Gracilibacillus caseinilyticus]UOQ50011.1 fumarylacetoacetate hydrolase family protein [Gracilibacillus caseinilyticus]
MKLVRYRFKHPYAQSRMGIVQGDHVLDISGLQHELIERGTLDAATYLIPSDPQAFYQQAQFHIEQTEQLLPHMKDTDSLHMHKREDVVLEAPVPNPSKIICTGINYANHVKEMGSDIPKYPVLFSKFNNALIGPEDDIHNPQTTNKLDYEVELAVVIGKRASYVKKEDALTYVAGYTIANDISARDLQKRTPQWLQGKSLDHTTPIGPWLVTRSELADPSNLAITSYVNQEVRQSSNTKHLIFDIEYLISFISSLMTLEPGDIIFTGTPDGVGLAMNPSRFLQAGDTVKLEIEKVGTLTNRVIDK